MKPMNIDLEFDKCIYCLENKADTWEHIIPESIGGRLQLNILCSKCNSELGSRLISKVKEDPSIRLAIHNLKQDIPDLFESMEHNQIYMAKDNNKNIVKFRYKDSKLQIIEEEKKDGIKVLNDRNTINYIEKKLTENGMSKNEVASKIHLFRELGSDNPILLSKQLKAEKKSLNSVSPDLEKPLLDEKFILLMVYEFMSIFLRDTICDEKFDFIRKFIKNNEKSDRIIIEHLITGEYSPSHDISIGFLKEEVKIVIVLFGWLVKRVHIKGIHNDLDHPSLVYFEDLKYKKSKIANSIDDAKIGKFYELPG